MNTLAGSQQWINLYQKRENIITNTVIWHLMLIFLRLISFEEQISLKRYMDVTKKSFLVFKKMNNSLSFLVGAS